MLSTEGFCEGESTDVSPGSTLNKCPNRYTPTTVTDSENETTMIADENEEDIEEDGTITTTRRTILHKAKGQKTTSKAPDVMVEIVGITRTESKDDGMDCNFVSEDENQDVKMSNQEENDEEPIYVNACNEANEKNLQQTELLRTKNNHSINNNVYVANAYFFLLEHFYYKYSRHYIQFIYSNFSFFKQFPFNIF